MLLDSVLEDADVGYSFVVFGVELPELRLIEILGLLPDLAEPVLGGGLLDLQVVDGILHFLQNIGVA